MLGSTGTKTSGSPGADGPARTKSSGSREAESKGCKLDADQNQGITRSNTAGRRQGRRWRQGKDGGKKIQMLMLHYALPASQDAGVACLPLRQCTNITD